MCHRIDSSNRYVLTNNGRTYASKIFLLKEGKLRSEYQSPTFDYGFSPCEVGLKSKPSKNKQSVQFAIDVRIVYSKQLVHSWWPRQLMQKITAGYHISMLPNERSLWEEPDSSRVDIPVAFDLMDDSILFYDGKSISVEVFYLVKPNLIFQDIPIRIWNRYFSTSQETYTLIYKEAAKCK